MTSQLEVIDEAQATSISAEDAANMKEPLSELLQTLSKVLALLSKNKILVKSLVSREQKSQSLAQVIADLEGAEMQEYLFNSLAAVMLTCLEAAQPQELLCKLRFQMKSVEHLQGEPGFSQIWQVVDILTSIFRLGGEEAQALVLSFIKEQQL